MAVETGTGVAIRNRHSSRWVMSQPSEVTDEVKKVEARSASGIASGDRAPRVTASRKRAICPALAISVSHAWALIWKAQSSAGRRLRAPAASSEVEALPAAALVDE